MANPKNIGNTSTGELPVSDPPDKDEIRQIRLLEEAELRTFVATPSKIAPFDRVKLQWDVKMPTTVISGVQVEVHVHAIDDLTVNPIGSRLVAPFRDSTYTIFLKTPLAQRQLGTTAVALDFGACQALLSTDFPKKVKEAADKAFRGVGNATLRGGGATVDIGINSFVVDIPIDVLVKDFPLEFADLHAEIDITLGFDVISKNGQVLVSPGVARTKVSFGTVPAAISSGCTALIALALEAQSDAYLSGFVGPAIAQRIRDGIVFAINEARLTLNKNGLPGGYKFYDFELTNFTMLTRFCPAIPKPPNAMPLPVHQ